MLYLTVVKKYLWINKRKEECIVKKRGMYCEEKRKAFGNGKRK